MVAAEQLCDVVVEAIRASSLERWPGVAARRAAGPYHDVADELAHQALQIASRDMAPQY
jgi:hypothetical protein